ncbi:MAG: hypothetical protein ABH860_02675 [bacterium]
MFLNKKVFLGAIILSIILIGSGSSYAQGQLSAMTGGSYTIEPYVMDSFGATGESSDYRLYDAGGQPSPAGTSEGESYIMEIGFVPATLTTEGVSAGTATLSLKVYLQGFYSTSTGQQVTTEVVAEIRSGTSAATAVTRIASVEIALDEYGTGEGELPSVSGDYYVVIKHKLSTYEAGTNHLAIITSTEATFAGGVTTIVNVSASLEANYFVAYTPTNDPAAMYTESDGKQSLRAGDINGDKYIRITDFGLWLAANGKDLGQSGYDVRADLDSNGYVRITDFGIWLSNNGKDSYVP